MPCNNIEEDKIDRVLQNVAFKWPHEMCEDVHEKYFDEKRRPNFWYCTKCSN